MYDIRYFLVKVKFKFFGNNKEIISNYFRKYGMKIGERCNICCNIMTMEPFMVDIGENVTISGNVKLVTHDNSVAKLNVGGADVFGRIKIGDNCFIGQNSIVMYGVELANNIIVAAGSVVCNSFSESNIVIGGNPARKIGMWNSLREKSAPLAISRTKARQMAEINDYTLFIKRKEGLK